MNDNKSKEYILLTNLELKIDVLPCCPCLLSHNAMSLSLAVDARRLTKCLANFFISEAKNQGLLRVV